MKGKKQNAIIHLCSKVTIMQVTMHYKNLSKNLE